MSNVKHQEPVEIDPVKWRLTIAGVIGIMAIGAVFVTWNYIIRNRMEAKDPRPPIHGRLERDLTAVNRDGREVSLHELKGKVWVACAVYTGSPDFAALLAGHLKEIYSEFGGRDDFYVVMFSIDSEGDTPEMTDSFVNEHGTDKPNWWFLTGDDDAIRKYLVRYFRFEGVFENTDPAVIAEHGRFRHDIRLALVDGQAHVRGYYTPTNPEWGDMDMVRLRHDIEYLLHRDDPAGAGGGSNSSSKEKPAPDTTASP